MDPQEPIHAAQGQQFCSGQFLLQLIGLQDSVRANLGVMLILALEICRFSTSVDSQMIGRRTAELTSYAQEPLSTTMYVSPLFQQFV